jgi:hypothetical protein
MAQGELLMGRLPKIITYLTGGGPVEPAGGDARELKRQP